MSYKYTTCAVCGKKIQEGRTAYCKEGELQICCSLECFALLNYPQHITIDEKTAELKGFKLFNQE